MALRVFPLLLLLHALSLFAHLLVNAQKLVMCGFELVIPDFIPRIVSQVFLSALIPQRFG